MTTKERKRMKHSLKTDIDSADLCIRMLLTDKPFLREDETKSESRAYLVSRLEGLRDCIEAGAADFIAEINRAITDAYKDIM